MYVVRLAARDRGMIGAHYQGALERLHNEVGPHHRMDTTCMSSTCTALLGASSNVWWLPWAGLPPATIRVVPCTPVWRCAVVRASQQAQARTLSNIRHCLPVAQGDGAVFCQVLPGLQHCHAGVAALIPAGQEGRSKCANAAEESLASGHHCYSGWRSRPACASGRACQLRAAQENVPLWAP